MDQAEQERRLRVKAKGIREAATEDGAVKMLGELLSAVATVNQAGNFGLDVTALSDKQLLGFIEQGCTKAIECSKELERRVHAANPSWV